MKFQKNHSLVHPSPAIRTVHSRNINEALDLTDTNQELFISMSHNIFGVLSIAIVVPILEEVLFRGAIEGHLLRKGWSPKWAILVSALIFGIIHGNPAQIPLHFSSVCSSDGYIIAPEV